jgi:Uma2 family endonuclease
VAEPCPARRGDRQNANGYRLGPDALKRMMLNASSQRRSRHRHSYDEYLAYERDSGLKHEYEDGEILAMAGGSRRHNALASRISAALESARKPGCIAFQSDQKVRILATGKATYPDASMVCGPIQGDPADPSGQTVSNPSLIVEVLSASTEEEDRGNEWQHYQLIPSLNEYVLVSQTHARIECYRRMASGAWEYRDFTEGAVQLSIGATFDIATLYADLPA